MRQAAPRSCTFLRAFARAPLSALLGAYCCLLACQIYDESLLASGAGDGAVKAGASSVDPGGNSSAAGGRASTAGAGQSGQAGEVAGEPVGGAGGTLGPAPQGGMPAQGGTMGEGGAPVELPGDLIDGFEDQDDVLEQTDGRGGVWYLFDDGTAGSLEPSPLECVELVDAPVELGLFALRITGSGFSDWGSGLGADFRDGKKLYDASAYRGIRFWAKVGEGKNTRHRLQIADVATDALGMRCNAAANAPNGEKCGDHFGINLTFSTGWQRYEVRFDELSQIGWGKSAPGLDASQVYGLQITAKAKLEVELWLDQIEFY
jgi:hypothetical protein